MAIRISAPSLQRENGTLSLVYSIKGMDAEYLSFRFSGAEANFASQSSDAALIALLLPAMTLGDDIHIDGPISPRLHFNVAEYIIPLLTTAFPGAKKISVTANEPRTMELAREPAVITGMSNGVDSLHVCATHLRPEVPKQLRPTHFLFHDVGSHGPTENERAAFLMSERLEKSRASAESLGIPLITVGSNVDDFFDGRYEQSHTLRSASVALALSGRASTFLYASGVAYNGLTVIGAEDTAYFDGVLLPLIKTESMECVSAGAASARTQKTKIVSDYEFSHNRLNVCVRDVENCSKCWKCMRTMFTLDLLGRVEKYSSVFDIGKYRKRRWRYVSHILAASRDNVFVEEIRQLMDAEKFKASPREVVFAKALKLLRYIATKGNIRRAKSLYQGIAGAPVDH